MHWIGVHTYTHTHTHIHTHTHTHSHAHTYSHTHTHTHTLTYLAMHDGGNAWVFFQCREWFLQIRVGIRKGMCKIHDIGARESIREGEDVSRFQHSFGSYRFIEINRWSTCVFVVAYVLSPMPPIQILVLYWKYCRFHTVIVQGIGFLHIDDIESNPQRKYRHWMICGCSCDCRFGWIGCEISLQLCDGDTEIVPLYVAVGIEVVA